MNWSVFGKAFLCETANTCINKNILAFLRNFNKFTLLF